MYISNIFVLCFRTIFGAVHDVQLEKVLSEDDSEYDLRSGSASGDVVDRDGRKSTIKMGRTNTGPSPMMGQGSGAVTPGPAKIDKRLAQVQVHVILSFFSDLRL